MTIPAIGALPGVSAPTGLSGLSGISSPTGTSGADFSNVLTSAVDNLQSAQSTSDSLAVKAVTGDLTDIHAATIAATRAQVMLELVSTVRNKGVDAFNEIMRMQA